VVSTHGLEFISLHSRLAVGMTEHCVLLFRTGGKMCLSCTLEAVLLLQLW